MSSPYISDGKLFIGANDGYLYAFAHNPVIWEGTVTLHPGKINITLSDGSTAEIDGLSALATLVSASELGGFNISISNTTWGFFIDSIGGITDSWLYWVNYPVDGFPSVGAADMIVNNTDVITYYVGGFNPPDWNPSTPPESDYVVRIHVQIPEVAYLSSMNVTPSASRGGNATVWLNATSLAGDGWFVVVISGVNKNGDSIAGISTLYLSQGVEVRVPVLVPIPQ